MSHVKEKSRWITFDECCEELRLPPRVVRRLIKNGQLLGVVNGRYNDVGDWRILDPSEKYKKALTVQENILHHAHTIDLMEFPVIATADFAAIAGVSQGIVRKAILHGKLVPAKIGVYSLFTASQVREFIVARSGGEQKYVRARIEGLVSWCLEQLEKNPVKELTADQVEKDDRLEGTLRRIMRAKEPERGKRLSEFWRRFELAQGVAKSIHRQRQSA